MTDLQELVISGLIRQECDLGNPVFTWDEQSYPCVPSLSVQTRNLHDGVSLEEGISLDARIFDDSGTDLYDGIYPQSKRSTITFRNIEYRIESIQADTTNSFFILICVSPDNGI